MDIFGLSMLSYLTDHLITYASLGTAKKWGTGSSPYSYRIFILQGDHLEVYLEPTLGSTLYLGAQTYETRHSSTQGGPFYI